jgi:hypothetical protein
MPRRKQLSRTPAAPAEPPSPPEIFEATLGRQGSVVKGKAINQAEAEARRKAGLDVVVCGSDSDVNRRLAGQIERNANGAAKRSFPHKSAGPHALPHFQPDPRPPEGHTFYETEHRKAAKGT